MDGGRVVQCGAPREVYERPEAEFVADFLGVANLFDVDCPRVGRGRASGARGQRPRSSPACPPISPRTCARCRPSRGGDSRPGGETGEGRRARPRRAHGVPGFDDVGRICGCVHGPPCRCSSPTRLGEDPPADGSAVTAVSRPGRCALVATQLPPPGRRKKPTRRCRQLLADVSAGVSRSEAELVKGRAVVAPAAQHEPGEEQREQGAGQHDRGERVQRGRGCVAHGAVAA